LLQIEELLEKKTEDRAVKKPVQKHVEQLKFDDLDPSALGKKWPIHYLRCSAIEITYFSVLMRNNPRVLSKVGNRN
jgi:hypothetical protein